MKTLFLLLLFAVSASAQTLKWTAEIPPPSSLFYYQEHSDIRPFPDGGGGIILILELRLASNYELAGTRIVWVTSKGKVLSHDIDTQTVAVVRVTKQSLLLRTGYENLGDPPSATRTQFTRIRNHRGKLVVRVSSIEEPISSGFSVTREPMPRDPVGFFRYDVTENGVTVQRYID